MKSPLEFWHRLDQHSGAILLAGVAASLVINVLAYRRDMKAARRLREVKPRPVLPLSQQLKTIGYRIRTVLTSRAQTAYALKGADYLQQSSRWFRNRLVQGFRFHQWWDVFSSLRGAGASLFILAGPLAVLMGWRAIAFAWLSGLFHLSLSQARLAVFFRRTGFARIDFFKSQMEFIGFTLVSDVAMVKGLFNSFNRRERKTW